MRFDEPKPFVYSSGNLGEEISRISIIQFGGIIDGGTGFVSKSGKSLGDRRRLMNDRRAGGQGFEGEFQGFLDDSRESAQLQMDLRDGAIAGEVPGCRTVAGSVTTKALEEQFMHIAAGEREKVA